MIKSILNIIYYCLLYPFIKLIRIKFIHNNYKTKNSYWIKTYKKTNNIPDTKYTLW